MRDLYSGMQFLLTTDFSSCKISKKKKKKSSRALHKASRANISLLATPLHRALTQAGEIQKAAELWAARWLLSICRWKIGFLSRKSFPPSPCSATSLRNIFSIKKPTNKQSASYMHSFFFAQGNPRVAEDGSGCPGTGRCEQQSCFAL